MPIVLVAVLVLLLLANQDSGGAGGAYLPPGAMGPVAPVGGLPKAKKAAGSWTNAPSSIPTRGVEARSASQPYTPPSPPPAQPVWMAEPPGFLEPPPVTTTYVGPPGKFAALPVNTSVFR
jgi:hypothetical protein